MLLSSYEEFPISEIKLYDNLAERQEPIGKACDIMILKDIQMLNSHTQLTQKKPLQELILLWLIFALDYMPCELDEKIPLNYGVVGQETCGPGGMAYGMRSITGVLKF